MQQKFKVTGLGLQIDKVTILPGSELVLSAPAPGHWSRFGTADQGASRTEAKSEPKEMTVATPKAGRPRKADK